MIFEKLFLQLVIFLFEETFCIKKFKFSRKKVQKVDFHIRSKFSISTEWIKKSIASFKRHRNYLSIDAKGYKK